MTTNSEAGFFGAFLMKPDFCKSGKIFAQLFTSCGVIARSFTDAPVIQPRVPSLFEPTAVEFLDEQQSSTPAIAARETSTTKSVGNVPDALAEESLPKPDTPAHEKTPAIAQARRVFLAGVLRDDRSRRAY